MALYRISGWFVCHDVRYSGHVECVIERDAVPTADEAEPHLWPLADAQLDSMFPGDRGSGWRNDFTNVTVTALTA